MRVSSGRGRHRHDILQRFPRQSKMHSIIQLDFIHSRLQIKDRWSEGRERDDRTTSVKPCERWKEQGSMCSSEHHSLEMITYVDERSNRSMRKYRRYQWRGQSEGQGCLRQWSLRERLERRKIEGKGRTRGRCWAWFRMSRTMSDRAQSGIEQDLRRLIYAAFIQRSDEKENFDYPND